MLFSDAAGAEWCDLLANIQTVIDIYPADIQLTVDSSTSHDEWTVQWFRNGVPLPSGSVSDPTLRVISRATGSDLLSVTMTAIGSGAAYKYDSSLVLSPGEAVVAEVTATIDDATRTWRKILSRDSS